MFTNSLRKFALGTAALLAMTSMASAQLQGGGGGFSGQPTGGISPGEPKPKGCPHTGTEWVDPKVSSMGALVCTGTSFTIDIGVNGVGGSVSVTTQGCPAFLIIAPGHDKKIQKLHFRAVNPQDVPWQKQKYKCKSSLFSTTCVPDGGPTEQSQKETDWDEEACDVK